jgi:hypothetical protein
MLENTEGAIKMNNPEKLATYGTQDEEKQSRNTTQYVLGTTMRKQTRIADVILLYLNNLTDDDDQIIISEV